MLPAEGDAQGAADAVARRSYGKLVAFLAARTHDVAAAEDALSEAFAAALVDWPRNGCPTNPEAWLLTVARRKLIDLTRRERIVEFQPMVEGLEFAAADLTTEEVPDRRLALIFACTHPAIDAAIRAPLILQTILGLDAGRIASAFLISPATMGQRLVRAKTKIRQAAIPFSIPARDELSDRLDSVLNAIYAAFSEGWLDATGTDPVRRDLAEEAIFLGSLITQLLPDEPEAMGLLALMLYAEARRAARRSMQGDYIPLADQDPALWDAPKIAEAEALLRHASTRGQIGRYQLEAAIQSAHVSRRRTGVANWDSILQLYDALLAVSSSPVVVINRAVIIGEIRGPSEALEALKAIEGDPRLASYQPYWAVHADLLARIGADFQAREAYEIAIGLERDPAIRRFLQQRQSLVTHESLTAG
jgi:predicted RNA polymerase sigma factor